ncbi:MAG: response regulator [Lachnospiraceae bacterium]|nr:response regulator [Lachnospiraceae bacterium]
MYYNISFDIAAILVLTVIAVGMKTVLYTDTRGHKLMLIYVISVIVSANIDIITAYTICYGHMVPDPLNLILNTLYQYTTVFSVAVAMRTILSYFPGASKTSVIINRTLLYIQAGFVTLNIFTGIMFRFRDGYYAHGPVYFAAYIISLAVVLHMLFVVLKNRSGMPGLMIRIIILFLFLPTVFTVIQMIAGNILLIAFGEAFSALIMLFALETPDYRKLMKTMKELEAAREEANIANNAKSDFLASMSHEIRTPINGILGMNTMILRDSDDPQIIEYAENIRIAGNGLLSIINDILDLSKIESGAVKLQPSDYELSSILNDCYQINRTRAAEKGLEFIFENDPDMPSGYYGDEVRIRQIINNLLSNGIKYTEEGSVLLKAGYIEDDTTKSAGTSGDEDDKPGILKISVTDTGIGIKEEDFDLLFKSFSRLDEIKNRHIEGSGLGLMITNQLVSMMNGTIDVKSEYGKGSTFTVMIPQKVTDRAKPGDLAARFKEPVNSAAKAADIFSAPGKKVLIVDDMKMNILVFRGLLKGTELTIDSALSGVEAIRMTEKTRYDIIFMDHLMPEMDGVEAFHRIHDDKDNPNNDTPVVVLTANAIVGMRDSYLEEGFAEYISKPIDQKKLLSVTKQLLS